MTTTTTTTAPAELARFDAPTLPLAFGEPCGTFASAVSMSRTLPDTAPVVLQQRGYGSTLIAVRILSVENGTTVNLVGFAGGQWTGTPVSVNVNDMHGANWYLIDPAAPADAPAADAPLTVIPRTAADALTRAAVLRAYGLPAGARRMERLAEWLPGGSVNERAHQFANEVDLCGEYEAAVCPTLGWLPRRGAGNSRAYLCDAFRESLDALEREHQHNEAAAIDAAIARVARGGIVNVAIVEHAQSHLERFKRPGVDALLEELGMDTIGGARSDYAVEVTVTRRRTIIESATFTVEVEDAEDEDHAADRARDIATEWEYLSGAYWSTDDDEYDTDVDDVVVDSVDVM